MQTSTTYNLVNADMYPARRIRVVAGGRFTVLVKPSRGDARRRAIAASLEFAS